MALTLTFVPCYRMVPPSPLYAFDGHTVTRKDGTQVQTWHVPPLGPRGRPLRPHADLKVQQTDAALRETLYSALARESGQEVTTIFIDAMDMVNATFVYRQGERLLMRTWSTDERGVVRLDPTTYDVQRQVSFLVVQ